MYLTEECKNIIPHIPRFSLSKKELIHKETFIKRLEEYEKYLGKKIDISEVNYEWAMLFIDWLKLHKRFSINTINRETSDLKYFLRKLKKDGKIIYCGDDIRHGGWEKKRQFIISIETILKLRSVDLHRRGLERIRDIFICQCFTGLKMKELIPFMENIHLYIKKSNSGNFFAIPTPKESAAIIPFSDVVMQIAEKRKYEWGNPIVSTAYNIMLEEIFEVAKINDKFKYFRTEGGEIVEKNKKISHIITEPVAIRTFATHAYVNGVNPDEILKITGHSNIYSFRRYIRTKRNSKSYKNKMEDNLSYSDIDVDIF